MTAEALPRAARLTRATDLRRCFAEGRRRRTAHLDMIWIHSPAGRTRIGLIVPRHRSTAVARNRLRRRLREIWRRELQSTVPPYDVVVRARPEAYAASFDQLREDLRRWARSLGGAA